MRRAFELGKSEFGKSNKQAEVAPVNQPRPKKQFSLYTEGLVAPGGGKPAIVERYNKHQYTPLTPVVNPKQHQISNPITPEQAAKLYVPHAPLQYTSDRLRV